MISSASLVGFSSGKPLLAVFTVFGWLPLLAPCVLMPIKPVAKP